MLDVTKLNGTIGEMQRDYLYKLDIISIPSGLITAFPNANEFIKSADLYIYTFPIPESANKMIQVPWAGSFAFYSGPTENTGKVDFTVKGDAKWDAYGFFHAWKTLGGDDENQVSVGKMAYLGEVKLSLVHVDKTTVKQAFVLKNFYPNKVDRVDLGKGSDKIMEFKVSAVFEGKKRLSANLGQI